MDDHLKQLLKELADAINDSISTSSEVNARIRRIRDEGYNLYVLLDATIGLSPMDSAGQASDGATPESHELKQTLALPGVESQFRINVNDLAFLRSVGIDPTRKVRSSRKS